MDKVDQQYLNELSMGSQSATKNAYNVHFKIASMIEDDMPVCIINLVKPYQLSLSGNTC